MRLDVLLKNPVALKVSLGLEQGAAYHPPDPHLFFILRGGGDSRLFGPMCLLFLNRCREWFHCLRSFSFFFSIL